MEPGGSRDAGIQLKRPRLTANGSHNPSQQATQPTGSVRLDQRQPPKVAGAGTADQQASLSAGQAPASQQQAAQSLRHRSAAGARPSQPSQREAAPVQAAARAVPKSQATGKLGQGPGPQSMQPPTLARSRQPADSQPASQATPAKPRSPAAEAAALAALARQAASPHGGAIPSSSPVCTCLL